MALPVRSTLRTPSGDGVLARLAAFVEGRRRPIELVPTLDVVFAIEGGEGVGCDLAWFTPEGEYHLGDVARGRGLPAQVVDTLRNRLRWCTTAHVLAPRREALIGGRRVVVIPSERLAEDIRGIVIDVLAWPLPRPPRN